jgi:hypothetical protein
MASTRIDGKYRKAKRKGQSATRRRGEGATGREGRRIFYFLFSIFHLLLKRRARGREGEKDFPFFIFYFSFAIQELLKRRSEGDRA